MTFNPQLIWFLAGLALILFEFMIPGVILVFFGMGAWTVAITAWLKLTPGWTSQTMLFAISSVVYLIVLRRWFQAKFIGFEADRQSPTHNLDDFKGQSVLVIKDITPGESGGRVEFKGAEWAARSDRSIAAGQSARVLDADSITLIVEPE